RGIALGSGLRKGGERQGRERDPGAREYAGRTRACAAQLRKTIVRARTDLVYLSQRTRPRTKRRPRTHHCIGGRNRRSEGGGGLAETDWVALHSPQRGMNASSLSP